MKISYRSVEILLRYYVFVSFDWGRYIGSNFPDLQLFESFPTRVAQNDPQWPILPPKWLGLAQNGQFSTFPRFPPKKQLILTRNGQFHPIHFFSNLFPPNWFIFGQISKFWGGGVGEHWPNFPRFATF